MKNKLSKLKDTPQRKGPVVLVIMDGIAYGEETKGNAVFLARTPTLDSLEKGMKTTLLAHGCAVGMPTNKDMGNSEVGHNTLGAGRVFAQGATLVNEAFASGEIFQGVWEQCIQRCIRFKSRLHFLGLCSDGNVHSHEDHLHQMILKADQDGVTDVCVHILLDGRDVQGRSALEYVAKLETILKKINENVDRDYRIASGGGRMVLTMDRYEADWSMVERGWQVHVHGKGRAFSSAAEAIETFYKEDPEINDQFLPGFVIFDDLGEPLGRMQDEDACLLFNFRGDRAIEISRAFEEESFTQFSRDPRPDILFAGMMQYDGDLGIPRKFLVEPPQIEGTVSEFLSAEGVRQFAISETQKFGHVTFFWNGNRSQKFDEFTETYVEVPSDKIPCEQRPWMKAAEITDEVIQQIQRGDSSFLRLNYPNGDMVGHTGDLDAAILSVEAVDLSLKRLLKAVEKSGGVALVTADHGNADCMIECDAHGEFLRNADGSMKTKTSHTLNSVPFYIFDPSYHQEYQFREMENAGLSNVAATILYFLGYSAPESYDAALVCSIQNG